MYPDTNGAEESVVVSEVSSFQRLKCVQEWYLGWVKVSCLERCPQFRSVLIERGGGGGSNVYIYVYYEVASVSVSMVCSVVMPQVPDPAQLNHQGPTHSSPYPPQ